eukprot:Skav219822  [mRNA]  locus=scaffold1238:58127:65595:- [translate_table: standard]
MVFDDDRDDRWRRMARRLDCQSNKVLQQEWRGTWGAGEAMDDLLMDKPGEPEGKHAKDMPRLTLPMAVAEYLAYYSADLFHPVPRVPITPPPRARITNFTQHFIEKEIVVPREPPKLSNGRDPRRSRDAHLRVAGGWSHGPVGATGSVPFTAHDSHGSNGDFIMVS